MYINITDSEKGNNKGSSGQLVHYLDKENRLFGELPEQRWFNGKQNGIPSYEVRSSLDQNVAKLCRDEAKFFLINVSPSQKEMEFLKDELGVDAEKRFKDYAVKVMDAYAKNFNRPGINNHKDLLWFAKLERHRYYSFRDKEVKSGQVKAGTVKPGEQMHIQIVVSRKDISNKIKLSPMNKSRGRNVVHSKKLGEFDRTAFKQSGEEIFDKYFGFERNVEETFRYANVQKKGTLKQRMSIKVELTNELRDRKASVYKKSRSVELNESKTYLQKPITSDFLSIALKSQEQNYAVPFQKRKKKKRKGQQEELGLSL
jgi:hypothetical protein